MSYLRVYQGFGQNEAGGGAGGAGAEGAPAAIVPVSRIEFYPDGTTVQRSVPGNTRAVDWWEELETALGVPKGEGRTAETLVEMANDLRSSQTFWKWTAIIGISVVGLAAWFAGGKWRR